MKLRNFAARVRDSFRTRRFSVGAYSVAAVVLVLAILVAVNLAVGALPTSAVQVDMTNEQLYSLSEQTEQRLSLLDRDVELYWLVQSGAEDPTLEQVLARYADCRHISVQSVDPVVYPSFAAQYTDSELSNNSVIVVCGERSLYIPYSEIWTYSDYEQYMYYMEYFGQSYADTFVGEQKLTGAIAYVTGEDLPVLYCLIGHGEAALSDDLKSAVTLQNYELRELNLVSEGTVPADCDALCILGAVRDLSETELDALREYVSGGGKLFVTTAYTEEAMPRFKALLSDWGVTVLDGLVLDDDSRYVRYGYLDMLLPTLQSHSITSPLSADGLSILFPDAQALVMDGENAGVKLSSLLTSSASSYVKASLSEQSDYEKTADDPAGPFVLALTGTQTEDGGKLVVFGSSLFMESDYSDMVAGANRDLFMNGLDWLCGHEDSISIRPKTVSVDYLTFSGHSALILAVLVLAVVPLGFLTAGIVTVVKRRRRG